MLLQIVTVCYGLLRALLTYGLLRRSHPRTPTTAAPFVSIIIAARNEAESLPTLLESLLAQTYGRYEVVIVDDRSTDATADVLREWSARDPRLKVVRVDDLPEGHTPKMHALAQGVAASDGALLLFTDADCAVPRTWVQGIVARFETGVGAVLGYVGLRAANNTVQEHVQALDYLAMMATMAGATNLGYPVGASGANLAYRRSAYEQAGGFEQMPTGAVADDMLLVQRVLDRTDQRVVFCDDPRTFIATDAEPTLPQLLDQRVRWMAGGQEVLSRNPALLVISSLIGTLNGILFSFPLLLARRRWRRALLQAVVGRMAAEALHVGVASVRFGQPHLLAYLPLWSILQVPYTMMVPLYSLSRKWAWKK